MIIWRKNSGNQPASNKMMHIVEHQKAAMGSHRQAVRQVFRQNGRDRAMEVNGGSDAYHLNSPGTSKGAGNSGQAASEASIEYQTDFGCAERSRPPTRFFRFPRGPK